MSKKKKTDRPWLIAVRLDTGNEIYAFKTEEDRQGFIDDITEKMPEVEWATTKIED